MKMVILKKENYYKGGPLPLINGPLRISYYDDGYIKR
jgi:hypothetical protein